MVFLSSFSRTRQKGYVRVRYDAAPSTVELTDTDVIYYNKQFFTHYNLYKACGIENEMNQKT